MAAGVESDARQDERHPDQDREVRVVVRSDVFGMSVGVGDGRHQVRDEGHGHDQNADDDEPVDRTQPPSGPASQAF